MCATPTPPPSPLPLPFQGNETNNNAKHPKPFMLTHMCKFEPIRPAILLIQPRSIRKPTRLTALAFRTRRAVEVRDMLISNIAEPAPISACTQEE